jgi:hypothetical protein
VGRSRPCVAKAPCAVMNSSGVTSETPSPRPYTGLRSDAIPCDGLAWRRRAVGGLTQDRVYATGDAFSPWGIPAGPCVSVLLG